VEKQEMGRVELRDRWGGNSPFRCDYISFLYIIFAVVTIIDLTLNLKIFMKKGMLCKFAILALVLILSFSNINAQTSGGTTTTYPSGKFIVTPNPSSSFAMVIAVGDGYSISRIAIYNKLGAMVSNNNYGDNVRVAMVDVSTLSADIYTISISSSTTTESQVLGVNFPLCPPYCP
jgi:hypothetical protein